MRIASTGLAEQLGPDSISAIYATYNFANALTDAGRLDEALATYLDLEQRLERTDSIGPKMLIDVELVLADILAWQGRVDEAIDKNELALAKRRAFYGDDDPNTINTLFVLGSRCMAVERIEEATSYFEEAVERADRVLGPKRPTRSRWSRTSEPAV
ncbi:MAG: tetratricopeptide repeat protein [Planctomycetota bacterium]